LGFATIANAEPTSFWFSGSGKDGNGTLAVGFGGDNFGIEFGIIDDANLPDGTLDYECPHSDYTSLGNKTLESNAGFDLIGMITFRKKLFFGGPGLYWRHTGEVVRSNATGWCYTTLNQTTLLQKSLVPDGSR